VSLSGKPSFRGGGRGVKENTLYYPIHTSLFHVSYVFSKKEEPLRGLAAKVLQAEGKRADVR
jgi:hypothetical protein